MKFIFKFGSKKLAFCVTAILGILGYQTFVIHQQNLIIQNPSQEYLLSKLRKLEQPELYNVITNVADANQALMESLIVGLANKLPTKISMYGRHVERDSRISSEPGRISYEMHPYAKAGSGISATIIDKDGFVLLGRKANSPIYILLGGYMKPYPLEGASGNELDSEDMDKIEEDLLLGKNNYSKMQPKTVKSTSYDFNLRATFNREIQEEAGITGNELARAKIFTVSISSDYGITNDPRLHTIVENICAYFKGERPNVKPGSDIAELIWVHTSQISKNTNLLPQQSISKESRYSFIKDGKQYISDHCGEIIERATEQVNELKQKGYFTTKVTNEKKSIS